MEEEREEIVEVMTHLNVAGKGTQGQKVGNVVVEKRTMATRS